MIMQKKSQSAKFVRLVGGPNDGQLVEMDRGRKLFPINAEWFNEYIITRKGDKFFYEFSGMVLA